MTTQHSRLPPKAMLQRVFFQLTTAFTLVLLINTADAAVAVGRFSPGKNVNLGTWGMAGDATSTINFCAMSTQGNRPNSATSSYAIRAYLQTNPGAAFTLESQINPADTLPVQLEFTDLYGGGSENLSPNTFTSQDKTGSQRNCPGSNNAELSITIFSDNLSSVPAATYAGNFSLEIQGGTGNQTKRARISITIVIPDLVKISNVAPIALGPYTLGTGNIVGSDTLCIFRSGGTAYQITASGSGAGGAFSLAGTSQTVPYTVTWQDSLSTQAVTPATPLTGLQGAVSNDNTCGAGSGNNAVLNVQVLEADISTLNEAGIFSDTITIMLAP